MRAIAASYVVGVDPVSGQDLIQPLRARIIVKHRNALSGSKRRYHLDIEGGYSPSGFTSLHRAKNAIRRHYSIPSRKTMRWAETTI